MQTPQGHNFNGILIKNAAAVWYCRRNGVKPVTPSFHILANEKMFSRPAGSHGREICRNEYIQRRYRAGNCCFK